MKKHDNNQTEKWAEEYGLKVKGMRVKVKGSDINSAISILKKRMLEEGISKELRVREYYESKGQKRRRLRQEATRRFHRQKREQKELENADIQPGPYRS